MCVYYALKNVSDTRGVRFQYVMKQEGNSSVGFKGLYWHERKKERNSERKKTLICSNIETAHKNNNSKTSSLATFVSSGNVSETG